MPNPLKRVLRVIANPYLALDVDDRPSAVVQLEGVRGRYVGAELDVPDSEREKKHIYRFTGQPVTVPDTAYYRRQIDDGALVPADEATAKLVGKEKFGDAAIAAVKAIALDEHRARFGKDAEIAEPLGPREDDATAIDASRFTPDVLEGKGPKESFR
jgi:hypothetical protein